MVYSRRVIAADLRPAGPYSLRLSARHGSDATRRFVDGIYTSTVAAGEAIEFVQAWQRPDGVISVRAESDAGVEHVRFVLGLDDDHSEFLERFSGDELLAAPIRQLRGLRPLRTATVAQALLRALAGQLITAREARATERRVIRAVTASRDGLHLAPTTADLARLAPAQFRSLGLGARRGSALVRICRSTDLEGLKRHPTGAAAARLERERGLGPWSAGVVCLEGLGRFERGLARDLGMVKLANALWGRTVEPHETDVLLEPYGEWAGLASVYLLSGFHAGLLRSAIRDAPVGEPNRPARSI